MKKKTCVSLSWLNNDIKTHLKLFFGLFGVGSGSWIPQVWSLWAGSWICARCSLLLRVVLDPILLTCFQLWVLDLCALMPWWFYPVSCLRGFVRNWSGGLQPDWTSLIRKLCGSTETVSYRKRDFSFRLKNCCPGSWDTWEKWNLGYIAVTFNGEATFETQRFFLAKRTLGVSAIQICVDSSWWCDIVRGG